MIRGHGVYSQIAQVMPAIGLQQHAARGRNARCIQARCAAGRRRETAMGIVAGDHGDGMLIGICFSELPDNTSAGPREVRDF